MRDVVLQAWQGIALAALMAILTVMMVTGLGSRRGSWLHGLRLSLWMLVVGLGGAVGCDEAKTEGDTGNPDTWTCVECYVPPPDDWWPDEPDVVDPDMTLDMDEVVDAPIDRVDEQDVEDVTQEDVGDED